MPMRAVEHEPDEVERRFAEGLAVQARRRREAAAGQLALFLRGGPNGDPNAAEDDGHHLDAREG